MDATGEDDVGGGTLDDSPPDEACSNATQSGRPSSRSMREGDSRPSGREVLGASIM